MQKKNLAAIWLAALCSSGCAYKADTSTAPARNVVTSYSNKIPGRWAVLVESERAQIELQALEQRPGRLDAAALRPERMPPAARPLELGRPLAQPYAAQSAIAGRINQVALLRRPPDQPEELEIELERVRAACQPHGHGHPKPEPRACQARAGGAASRLPRSGADPPSCRRSITRRRWLPTCFRKRLKTYSRTFLFFTIQSGRPSPFVSSLRFRPSN